jgi:hypothetical protein
LLVDPTLVTVNVNWVGETVKVPADRAPANKQSAMAATKSLPAKRVNEDVMIKAPGDPR